MNRLPIIRRIFFAALGLIIVLPTSSHCIDFKNLSGQFIRVSIHDGISDTVEGRFFHNGRNGNTLIEVQRPLKQFLRSSPEAFLVYYPESNRAFHYKGSKGQGLIDFMENFLAAVKNDLGLLLKGSRKVSSVTQGDAMYHFYESVRRNADGPLVLIDVRKRRMKNRELMESVVVRTQNVDTIAVSLFSQYTTAGTVMYPQISSLQKGPKGKREETLLRVTDLRANEKWPQDKTELRVPASCRVEEF